MRLLDVREDHALRRSTRAALARRGAASLGLALVLVAPASPGLAAEVSTTTRVSVSSRGKQVKAWSGYTSISADGRYVAFETSGRRLVAGDTNGRSDVFVHDRSTGKTRRVSVSSTGEQGDDWSGYAAISGNGRFVAFTSAASNLVADDTNGKEDVFVRDRETHTTERVSVSSTGEQGNADSAYPATSADGRFVAFTSAASNLVSGDGNGQVDVFVHDRATHETTRISVSSSGTESDGRSDYLPPGAMSASGRFVAFASAASNLVANDGNGTFDVFVHDRTTGETRRVSVDSNGVEGNTTSYLASMSANGRFVVFESSADNLVPGDGNGQSDVFVHDLQHGKTERVSVGAAGVEGNDWSNNPTISRNGRFVAFDSYASNLIGSDHNDATDVFVRDRKKGRTRRVSVGPARVEANGHSEAPAISADARHVAFGTYATNLVGGDANDEIDVCVRGPIR
ncbi:MAG: hypothetical protein AB1689_00920 [Thermodesulfobacteriota bacterium]